jgi:hypothetical protein
MSYLAASVLGPRANVAAPTAAAERNSRRFNIGVLLSFSYRGVGGVEPVCQQVIAIPHLLSWFPIKNSGAEAYDWFWITVG